jgi:hypothetical protein
MSSNRIGHSECPTPDASPPDAASRRSGDRQSGGIMRVARSVPLILLAGLAGGLALVGMAPSFAASPTRAVPVTATATIEPEPEQCSIPDEPAPPSSTTSSADRQFADVPASMMADTPPAVNITILLAGTKTVTGMKAEDAAVTCVVKRGTDTVCWEVSLRNFPFDKYHPVPQVTGIGGKDVTVDFIRGKGRDGQLGPVTGFTVCMTVTNAKDHGITIQLTPK